MEKALVVFSGGQDSTTILGWSLKNFKYVECINFAYGQKHAIEIEQAKKIAQMLNVKLNTMEIDIFKKLDDSALLKADGDLSTLHDRHNLPSSYVPNRNALMFTISHAYGQKYGFDSIITGVCESDYSGYPDCREEFMIALQKALNLGSDCNIRFLYPLMKLSKAETFALAKESGVLDIVLEYSHTCYNGIRTIRHPWGYGCEECPSCLLRKRGYEEFVQREIV